MDRRLHQKKDLSSYEKPVDLFLSRLDGVKKTSGGWTAKCPAHDDGQNSLSIAETQDNKVLLKCFAGCLTETVVKALDLSMKDLFEKRRKSSLTPPETTATAQPTGCTLADYSKSKGISLDFLQRLGLKDGKYKNIPRVVIPYLNETGQEIAVRYRCALSKPKDGIDNRFFWKTGSKVHLYGLWKLEEFKTSKFLVLVEGESDSHTLWYHGFPALGIPGANNWKDEWAKYLEDFESIYMVIEPDKGGEASLNWIAKSKLRNKIRLLKLEPYKDPSELHISDPFGFDIFFNTCLSKSLSWKEEHEKILRAKALEIYKDCKELSSTPDILALFSQEFKKLGVVGVEQEAKIVFLSLVSRLLSRPLSLAIKGPSSAGKSYLVQEVLKFFPAEAFYVMSAMSEKALFFFDDPLIHRILVIYEASGMQNEMTSYLIRSLLSEGRICYTTVEKTQDGLQSKTLEKEGPTGLITTTTSTHLHPENETRMLSITLLDTQDQTKRIIESLANQNRAVFDYKPWHSLQQWLFSQRKEVLIPYSTSLSKLIPPVAVRLRRDFHQVLIMIKAHALLHQANRASTAKDEIVATIEDYSAVYNLTAKLIQQEVGEGVSASTRETVEAVQKILDLKKDDPDPFVTQIELKKELKLDKSSTSRRVRSAIEQNHLKNLEEKKGKPFRLVIGDPLPDEQELLPSPVRLTNKITEEESGQVSI